MSVIETMKVYLGVDDQNDIRSLLHDDHEQILSLLKEICEAGTAAKRTALFDALNPFLSAHARAEEQVVYTRLMSGRSSEDAKDLGNEGFVEHSLVDMLLARLSKTTLAGTGAWKAHAIVLKEILEHHIKEEEGEIFSVLGKEFSDEQRLAMGSAFTLEKNRLLTKKKVRKAA